MMPIPQTYQQETIMIVDDTTDNLRLLLHIFRNTGYVVRTATTGMMALQSIRVEQPDILLLDIMMPDINGYEVCKQLKADANTADIPIIFISALDGAFDKVKAFSVGGVDYIMRPFQEEEVLVRVQNQLMLRKTQKALQQSQKALKEANVQLEKQLQRQDTELHLAHIALDNSADGIYWISSDQKFIYVNTAACEELGYTCEELQQLTITDIDPDFVADAWLEYWENIKQRGSVIFESRHQRKDGTIFPVEVTASYIDYEGQAYICAFVHNISQRKQMEETLLQSKRQLRDANIVLEQEVVTRTAELEQSQLLLREFLDNSPAFIFVKNLDGQYILTNRYLEDFFGERYGSFIGKKDKDFFPEDAAQKLRDLDQQVIDKRIAFHEEEQVPHAGIIRTFLSIKFPIFDSQGKVVAVGGIATDITEQKKVESALYAAKDAAESANRSKSAFLANMSHELRTPLNAILGFTQLLQRRFDPDANIQQTLTVIHRNGEHLLALINTILDLSKIEAGHVTIQEKPFQLHRLLDELYDMFLLLAQNKGLTLRFEHRSEIPPYVITDQMKLRQTLMNILSNAIKFTSEGWVMLRVAVAKRPITRQLSEETSTTPTQHWLLIEIVDTGAGIAPEDVDRIFDAFVQTQIGQEASQGTGLGLSISQKFVALMHGTIHVESKIGRGTTFYIKIPIGVQEVYTEESISPERHAYAVAPGQPEYSMLVVDDNEENRVLLKSWLEPMGFELREASSGATALQVCKAWEPDLIWLDLRLPDMIGSEMITQIKATHLCQQSVIIALTASTREEERRAFFAAGGDDFVSKPFSETDILHMLQKHLGVSFLYEDSDNPHRSSDGTSGEETGGEEQGKTISTTSDMIASRLVLLPPPLLLKLEQTVIEANPLAIEQTIVLVESHDVALANILKDLADDFEYSRIRALVQIAKRTLDEQ